MLGASLKHLVVLGSGQWMRVVVELSTRALVVPNRTGIASGPVLIKTLARVLPNKVFSCRGYLGELK